MLGIRIHPKLGEWGARCARVHESYGVRESTALRSALNDCDVTQTGLREREAKRFGSGAPGDIVGQERFQAYPWAGRVTASTGLYEGPIFSVVNCVMCWCHVTTTAPVVLLDRLQTLTHFHHLHRAPCVRALARCTSTRLPATASAHIRPLGPASRVAGDGRIGVYA